MKAILRKSNVDDTMLELVTEKAGPKTNNCNYLWCVMHEDFLCIVNGDSVEAEKIKHEISENGFADIRISLTGDNNVG